MEGNGEDVAQKVKRRETKLSGVRVRPVVLADVIATKPRKRSIQSNQAIEHKYDIS